MRDDKKTKAQLLGELLELRNQIEALQGTETERARLTGILDSTTDYVGTATPDGRLTYMNREARHLLGWGEDEDLAGRQIADVHPSWALDSVFNEGISSALRDGIWGGETTLLRHDGVEIPVSQVIMAHRSPGGEVEYLSTIMRDMSEAKRAEQERLAHVRMLEALDEINQAFQGTDDLDQMMSDALEAVLSTFGADRAWLCFPCDPDAPTWQVPMQRTVPEYPSVLIQGVEMPMTPGLARDQRTLLSSQGPVRFGPGDEQPLPEEDSKQHRFLSQLALAVYPKVGPPWMFGLHQCSSPRLWTEEEKLIFEQIGRRMADALTSLLTRRDLRENEQKYRSLYSAINDGVCLHELVHDSSGRAVDYIILDVNPAYESILDIKAEDAIGRKASELYGAGEPPYLDIYAKVAETREPVSFETYFQPLDKYFGIAVFSPRQGQFATLFTDITEKELTKKKLEESEVNYRSIFEGTNDGIFVQDMETGAILDVNRKMVEMIGYTPDEVRRLDIGDMSSGEPPYTQEEALRWMQNAAAGTPQLFEWRVKHKNGRLFWVEVNLKRATIGGEERLLSAVRDISERKIAEEALRESEEKFRELVERALAGIVIVHKDVVEYVNPALVQMIGYDPEELVGQEVANFLDPQERDKVVDRFRRRMAGENVPSAYETRLVRKDGRMIDVEINAGIINYQGERANLTILRDITERKRAEQERLAHVRMLEALDQINRAIVGTDDLDQMMSDVLEATRSIFKADRAWLCFPCDPDAPTWRVPMDQTVPEYPGAIQLGVEVPLDPGAAEEFRMFLESDGPLSFGPSTEHPARKDFSEELRFKSQLAMAIYPKVGPPWLFGLHQCSHPRVWTEEEERILEQIGRRMADALTSLLTRRDLAESEERYRDLIEKEKDIIYALDSTGNITFASPAVTEVLGYLPEELIGRDFMELVPEDWQQRTEADFLSLLATGEITAETVLLDKDLQPRAVEYSSTVVKDGDQLTGTRGIVRDISQRKRAEEALEREHEQLLSIFESMDQIVYVTDPETYEVLFVNEVVRRSFEKDPVGGLCYREFQGLDAPCDFCTNPIITANKNEPYQWEYHNPTLGRDYALTDRIIKWPDDRDVRLEIAIDITERKRAEGALRESEEKFRELVERAQDGIVIIHQHLVEYVNLAYTRLTGYESEELVGQTYAILIDPRERDKVEDRYRRRMAGEDVPPIYETRLVRKDGRVIDVEFNAGTINYKGEPANLTIVRDIAERKRVEQERLAHVRMLEALDRINRAIQGTDDLDQMMADVLEATLAIFETDRAWLQFPCDPDAPTWRVPMLRTVLDHSNALIPGIEIPTEPEFAEVMRRFLGSEGPIGLTPEPDQLWMKEFAEKYGFQSSLAMAIHPKVGPPWLFGLHQCSHPRVWTAEEERILEQIGRRMADALTSLLTRRDLRESEEKFRNLFEGSGHSIIVLDRDGVVMMANPIAARNLERTPEQCRGRSIRELLPEGNAYPLERIAEVFDTGQEMIVEDLVPLASGPMWMRSILQPVRDAAGRIYGVQAMSYDITERVLAEREVKKLEQQLVQAQKMEAIGRLAGGVAHDFNNLLLVINGYSELVIRSLDPDDSRVRDLKQIMKAGVRAAELTNQLLAFSRRQVIMPRVLDLNLVVAGVEKMLQRLIGEDIKLSTSLAAELGSVKADPGQVEQVIMNLAVNARDAMPNGGVLTIETANVVLDQTYVQNHVGAAAGPHVMLAVSDTGKGMDEQTKAQAFEPFFTTKGKGLGTGLGLSTVYGIVKQSGGNILVYSEPGQGTTLRVYLPRVDEAAEVVPDETDQNAPTEGSETVLLVEDDDMVREYAAEVLQGKGYQVIAAGDGHEALKSCEHRAGTIDLLVTDVVMPGMSGRELVEHVMQMCPEIKVLYMSGYTDDIIAHHGVLDPGVNLISKPFSVEALAWKVRQVLDG